MADFRQRVGSFSVIFGMFWLISMVMKVNGIGANWGTQCSHPLSPDIVVRLLRENGIQKVKLFDADYTTLHALGNTGIEVMVGIPNDMLSTLASSSKAADRWVSENVTEHVNKNKVNIRFGFSSSSIILIHMLSCFLCLFRLECLCLTRVCVQMYNLGLIL